MSEAASEIAPMAARMSTMIFIDVPSRLFIFRPRRWIMIVIMV
jgi:hypothetical protein